MSGKAKGETGKTISRREFLKETGIVLGSVTLTYLALGSACGTSNSKTPETTAPTTTVTPAPTQKASPTSATSSTMISNTTSATSTSVDYSHYVPSPVAPQLLPIPNCITKAAVGYLYSPDNMWVLQLAGDVVAVGMSDKFQALVAFPKLITLPKVGDSVTKDTAFGSVEGSKLNCDLISPVTGSVLDMNYSLITLSNEGAGLEPIVDSPYLGGWMIVVQLSNPAELKTLLSPQQYVVLVTNLE